MMMSKKKVAVALFVVCLLCFLSKQVADFVAERDAHSLVELPYAEDLKKWDCTVPCAKESADSYVITYSNEKIISNTGTLLFQNRNDFDIVIYLCSNGYNQERTSEVPAGGVTILYEVTKGIEYTVGCHADVAEGTEIKLMVYDGEEAEVYSN